MRRLQFNFPSQIRISGWDFGSSARAMNQAGGKDSLMTYELRLFSQADAGKCPGSTFERKTMSSTIKRVALVAVAALGLASVSAISANAANLTSSSTAAVVQKAGTGDNGSGGVAGPANTLTVTLTPKGTSGEATSYGAFITVSGADSKILSPTAGSLTVASAASSAIFAATAGAATPSQDIILSTPTVGTITVNVYNSTTTTGTVYTSTPDATLTLTVRATSIAGSIDASTSTAVIKSGSTWSAGSSASTDDTVLASKTASATPAAVVKVVLGQGNGAVTGTTAVAASISGAGTIVLNDNNDATTSPIGSGRSLSSTVAATTETFYVLVQPDGNSGVGTVTVTAGSFTATKSVTFYGAVATLTFTPQLKSIVDTADGVAETDLDAVVGVITGKDAAGNAVPVAAADLTVSSTTEKTAQLITNAGAADATAARTLVNGTVIASGTKSLIVVDPTATKTGLKTITITHTATGVSTTASFYVALAEASSVTVVPSDSSADSGSKITYTITAKDAGGNPVPDVSASAGAYSMSTNLTTSTTLPTAATFVNGIGTVDVYAPVTSGSFELSVKLAAGALWAAALDDTTVSASAVSVVNPASNAVDAANEATDAANAATDAANAAAEAADAATAAAQDAQAAVAALATQVASLIAGIKAQITTLTNLVIKIQKKVKA